MTTENKEHAQTSLDFSTTLPPEVKPAAIVPAEPAPAAVVPTISGGLVTVDNVEEAVALVQKRASAAKRLKAAALSLTGPLDWCRMKAKDGTEVPYLQESGASKLIHAFGVEVRIGEPQRTSYPADKSHPDGSYEFVVQGEVRAAAFSQAWLPIIGSRWSVDGFFNKGGLVIPDPGDVRKASLTNWYVNAITKVLGLENVGWEDLKDSGIDPERVRGVEFKSKGQAPAPAPVHRTVTPPAPAVRADSPTGENAGGEIPPTPRPADGVRVYQPADVDGVLAVKLAFSDTDTRAKLKALGAKWDTQEKAWLLADTEENRTALAALGLTVPEPGGNL